MIKTFRDAEIAITEMQSSIRRTLRDVSDVKNQINLVRITNISPTTVVTPTPPAFDNIVPWLRVASGNPYVQIDTGTPSKSFLHKIVNTEDRLDLSVNWDEADATKQGYSAGVFADTTLTGSFPLQLRRINGGTPTEVLKVDGEGSIIPGTDNLANIGDSVAFPFRSLRLKKWEIFDHVLPVTTNNNDVGDTTHFVRHIYTTGMRLNSGTASLPVKTDGSKDLITAAINLASAEVTGVLPIAKGGSGGGITFNWSLIFSVTLVTTTLNYKDHAGTNQSMAVGTSVSLVSSTGQFTSGVLTNVV